jgi:hypothetical protein
MIYILLLPAIFLLWLGYRQYCWISHYSKAKKYFILSNGNLAFIFGVRETFHSTKLLALSIFTVLYFFVFENITTAESSQANHDLMAYTLLTVLSILCLILFAIQSKSEKKFNIILAKVQDFRKNSIISEVQKQQVLGSFVSAKMSFMVFSAIYSALNLSIIFLV